MKIITVKLKNNPYKIYIDHNFLGKVPEKINKLNLGNFGLVITSPKILSLHREKIEKAFGSKNYKIITVVDGEGAKSRKWLDKVIGELVKVDALSRKVFIVCLGGGTVGDLGGFAASVYKRGISYIQIPTTLLGQIDSSIGGKTAIDLKEAKNILGAFHQPKAVFIDTAFLKTLPKREMGQGLAEAIKYGAIKDKELFAFLRKNHKKILKLDSACILKLILTCASIKAKIVAEDEQEKKGLRTILNFGHTLAHALESSLQYKKLSHGEAVSLGMVYAAYLSKVLKKCSDIEVNCLEETLRLFSLPTRIKFNALTIYKSLTYDKKFISGEIRMVILRKIGKVEVIKKISSQNIKKTLKIFASY